MAKAKRLPSGSYRAQVFSHTDANGKRHYESFTAPTKAEAEMKAAEYSASKKRRARHDLTVGEAIDGYIRAKEGVLSPATIRGYVRMGSKFDPIRNLRIRSLTNERVQIFISDLSIKYSAKTVKNVYGLLCPAISLYSSDLHFKVTLPTLAKVKRVSPSDDDVMTLFRAASPKMQKCIALAAFGSFRRGEICALKYSDISGNIVSVHADIVQDKNNKWIYKEYPKTEESNRSLFFHEKIIRLLGEGNPNEYVVGYADPGSITQGFIKLRNRFNSSIRFHDLRHYYASIAAVLDIPSVYLSDMGGWKKDSPVMKEVYQNKITPLADLYSRKMADHFSNMI